METWSQNSYDEPLAEIYRQTEVACLRANPDPPPTLDGLIAAQPDFLPAHLLKIARLVGAKDASALPALERALAAVAPLERGADARDRAMLAGARAWLAREPLAAAKIYTQLSLEGRADTLALRLAQSCWYFLGRRANVRSVAEHALRTWSPASDGFDAVLAMAAFGAAETSDGARAEELAQRALAAEPRSPFAIHALAHALAIQGRPAAGANLLRSLTAEWRIAGRMDGHISWHLALFDLESGNAPAALAAFDREQLPAAARDAGSCADATDLLWRIELAGLDVGERWQPLAAAWVRLLTPGFWSFLDVLAGLALLRAGRDTEACALARELALVPDTAGVIAPGLATVPALAALDAFARGAFEDASRGLAKALPRLGGSLPQRDLLLLTRRIADRRRTSERELVPVAA